MDRRCRALLPCAFVRGSEFAPSSTNFLPCLIYLEHRPYVLTSELNEVEVKMDSLASRSQERAEYVKQREEWTNSMQLVRRFPVTLIQNLWN